MLLGETQESLKERGTGTETAFKLPLRIEDEREGRGGEAEEEEEEDNSRIGERRRASEKATQLSALYRGDEFLS